MYGKRLPDYQFQSMWNMKVWQKTVYDWISHRNLPFSAQDRHCAKSFVTAGS